MLIIKFLPLPNKTHLYPKPINLLHKTNMRKLLFALSLLISSVSSFGATKGFHVSGSKLLDGNDKEFIMRGCNYSYAWQRGHENTVIPAAKRIGCNTIRIQLSTGARWTKCSYNDVKRLIELCEANKLVCVLNTHDETGSDQVSDLMNAVNYWIELKDLLNEHASTVIVNISNEWFGTWNASSWAAGYKQAIPALRNAGIKNTLMVDAAGWGQYPQCVQKNGIEVVNADPQKNLMFSVHIYDDAGANDSKAQVSIDYTMSAGVPAVVGEFAYEHKGIPVSYQKVMDYCTQKGVGYMVWSWTGNGSEAKNCDMFGSYDDSQWLTNGTLTVKGTNGIQATAKECSVFSQTPGQDTGGNTGGNTGGDTSGSGSEQTLITPNHTFNDWADEPINIPASVFASATTADKLRIYYTTTASNAEIQTAYTDYNNKWVNVIEYKSISGSNYEEQSLKDILDYVKRSGFNVKGHGFTFTKATLVKPSSQNQGESETTLITPGTYIEDWEGPINIPASLFSNAASGDHLRIYYSAKSGSQIQLAYCDSYQNDLWVETITAKDIFGESHESQDLTSIIPHVQRSGFFVNGKLFTFVKATLVKSGTTGIEYPIVEFDPYQPMEIYTIQGVRVSEMQPGGFYIVRQGNSVFRIRK